MSYESARIREEASAAVPKPAVAAPIAPPTKGFKMSSTQWECSVCMARNLEKYNRCNSCEEPRPGSKPKPTQTSISNFKFGVHSAQTSFKFGTDSTIPISSDQPPQPLSFGSKKEEVTPTGFKFGATVGAPKETNEPGGFVEPIKKTEEAVGGSGNKVEEPALPETVSQSEFVDCSTNVDAAGDSSSVQDVPNSRIAESILKGSKKISVENGLNLYQIPLTKLAGRCSTAERFEFKIGKPMTDLHFTILLVGSSGSGKELLINNFINYIFNVDATDQFRFQLINPSREENGVRIYDIHHSKGFRVNYSLTIIDTPNFYEEDPAKNKEIAKTIEQFLEDKNGIQQVNLVGFVLDSSASYLESINLYIYCFLISLFGEDIKTKANFLFTSTENENEWLWFDIVEANLTTFNPNHKFDSSLFTCFTVIENFFCSLSQNAKSIVFSKRMSDEKKRLEESIERLKLRIQIDSEKLWELKRLKTIKENFAGNLTGIEFQLDANVVKKVALPFGKFATNCTECKMACHPDCDLTFWRGVFDCNVMDHWMEENVRTCRICPKKCLWNVHARESFKLINFKENLLNPLKRNYETTKDLTWQELAYELEADVEETKRNLLDLIETLLSSAEKVNSIAKQDPQSTQMRFIAIFYIIDVIGKLVKSEEEVERDEDVEWITKLQDLSQSAESIMFPPSPRFRIQLT